MNHWIIVPVILPALVAPFIVAAARYDILLQRVLGIAASVALLAVTAGLYWLASDGVVRPYALGNWPAPFGIILVLDRLSALMLLLTAVLAVVVVIYSAQGWDRRGRHFHALFQFQLMGVNGAFLTGDVFNLFVFFEVLLIASYGLMLHGAGAKRITEGLKYVAINLAGSTLFLFAVGLIYALTGTLNMADLALKVSMVPELDLALLRLGGCAAADRLRDQGCSRPASSLATRHLRGCLAARRGVLRHHDQGRRLRDPPRLRADLRWRRRRRGSAGRALPVARRRW